MRTEEAQGPFGEAHRQPLGEQLWGSREALENTISAQLGSLDFATAPVFVVNGLKREELIAMNSMILHELYFDCLGAEGEPDRALREAIARDFGSFERWRAEFVAMGKALGGGCAGCFSRIHIAIGS